MKDNLMTNPDDPIAPVVLTPGSAPLYEGLTKREFFAALAMQAIETNSNSADVNYLFKRAVEIADVLINELNRKE